MAPASVASMLHLDQTLNSAACELKYERSNHLVDLITKDESIRKLRFEVHILEDDCDELRDLLAQEEDRSDKMESMVNGSLKRAEEAEAALKDVEFTLQSQEQELSSLRAENKGLKNLTTDTSKVMTEKLELTHELSKLRPELEHLRAQSSASGSLLTEKLALQRKVSDLEVEVEGAKRDAQRALAKRRNTMHDLQQEDELDALRKSATREKRLREKAEASLEELRSELEEAKTTAQRHTVKDTEKAEKSAEVEVRSEELSRELSAEKKEKTKAEKALQKAQSDWEAQRAVLDDKLQQFRNKLRTTKEKLKETETALAGAQAEAATAVAIPKQPKKGAKKRTAASMEPDATTLGTPGDGAANKRSRKVPAVGEKSSFSITPFLNRTMSIAPDSPQQEEDEDEPEVEEAAPKAPQPNVIENEAEASPTVKATTKSDKKTPLQPVPASKRNIKKNATTLSKTSKVPLAKVVEEDEPATQEQQQQQQPAAVKPRPKVRKSLATFATFNLEPEPEKKKKRKLGGLGKTLFDEEDDVPAKAMPGRGLFGGGRLGPLAGLAGVTKGSFLVGGGGKKKGMMATEDGFQFSPLKKDKRNMSFLK